MVLSSGGMLSIASVGHGSAGGGAVSIRKVEQKPEEEKKIVIPKSKIKFHKIKKHDKFLVKGNLPENYISEIEVPKTNVDNMMKLSSKYTLVSFKIIDNSDSHYVKSCYMIDNISSEIRFKGEGTKAIQSLVEKALSDKDTEGRILADVKIVDGETSACGFFYKLGFRFVDDKKNLIMKNWLNGEKNILSPKLVGIMYLPKENVKKLSMYKQLF